MNGSNPGSNDPHRPAEEIELNSGKSRQTGSDPNPEMLEQALRETLDRAQNAPVSEAEMATLVSIAKKHGSVELNAHPIAADLVEALLAARFKMDRAQPEVWRRVSEQVAETLMEDPVAKPRLESLWKRLQELGAS